MNEEAKEVLMITVPYRNYEYYEKNKWKRGKNETNKRRQPKTLDI